MNPEEKSQSMLMWLLCIVAHFISPLIFGFAVAKNKEGALYRNSMQALTLSIVFAIVMIVLGVTVVGLILVPLVYLLYLIFVVLGAVAANNGSVYEPPITGGLAKKWFNA